MTEEEVAYLQLARENIESGNLVIQEGLYSRFSIGRFYYAMFHCATALLVHKDQSYSKHSAVISAFGKEFAKTGEMPERLHLYIREAFELRQAADYDPKADITQEAATEQSRRAEDFLSETEKYLNKTA